MANHSAYPHQGPGPSSYYQPPSSPHPSYGGHSPAPRANYYPYPAAPPQIVAHPAPQYHQPPPARGNHRGGHLNGSYNSRGAHHYHHSYHPQAQQPPSPYAHSPVNSPHHPPHPQHAAQHMPYSPQFTKYVQPYSPTYHYPSPTAPVFTPSWQIQQQQQPLSPLPKQLSVPPPNSQNFYDPSRNSRSQTTSVAHSPASAPAEPAPVEEEVAAAEDIPPTPIPVIPEPEAQPEALHEVDVPPSNAPIVSEDVPEPEAAEEPLGNIPSSSKTYLQMGTIDASELSALPSSPFNKSTNNNLPQWTIWSRRPQDPANAPGIIISPRAQPPPDVVQQALELKTPPPSPRAPPAIKLPHQTSDRTVLKASPDSLDPSQNNSTVPSSSVTESTSTSTVPGSPVSSHTSISVSGTPAKEAPKETVPTPDVTSSSTPDAAASEGAETPSKPGEEQKEDSSTTEAGTTDPSSATATTSEPPASAPVAPAPVTPVPSGPPPPKKSWASLLRPANSSSTSASSTPGLSRNTLPTSAVVGFSIPAVTSPSNPAVPVNPSQKSELLNLLSTGPAPPPTGFAAAAASATTNASAMKIRPRGLVNSGNMCFANAVLQILVYCPPFHKLFVELNRLLVGPVVGGNNNKDETTKGASGSTPLVDATASFLQEFLEDKEKKKGSSSRKLEVVGARGSVSGASGSGNGARSGKGKEKEVKEDGPDHDDWDGESFLPSYVYEAMKTKKIFDTMRGGHQEDAEEFLGFYLDTLEDELLSLLHSINPPAKENGDADVAIEEREETAPQEDDGWLEVGKRNRTVVTRTIKATESPITRIFGGKFRSTLRAPSQKDSVIVEDWRSLRLDIQRDQIHSIQDALSYISHPQPVQVTPKQGVTIEAQQQMLIEALPPILILHVKRFLYDTSVNGVVKVSKHVRFSPELEIGSDVIVPVAKKTQLARYKLFGAVYHHGLSAAGGHYTLDVLHPNRYPSSNPAARPVEGWVRIDDEFVSDVRPEDVFRAPERDDTRCAYLLFYRRV
ncbi:hypothetical protein CPB83DRAFT_890475 [Crepidotus variabilis]|uniref:ubiquitinyl hydrolase 1 n=1 Tax=Crepidotus variabilis TaxID=179855 RepID=A0A9P6EP55_9AGAR|nr:hypothetical protein CPB83DRAFT_890475 [Crepidotus variabilis]